MVRLRQLLYALRGRLLAVPLAFVVGAIVLATAMVRLDQRLDDDSIPEVLLTTVDGGRAMLTAIAGGLISSITLLLSLVLVAVQLASSQFSPRTLRDWTGNRTQQTTIGLVLGTAVYCLLVLRETRDLDEGAALIPHLSVLLAVALGVFSLIAVVRSVDDLTNSLRVGSVVRSLMEDTVQLIETRRESLERTQPRLTPPEQSLTAADEGVPPGAVAVSAAGPGWVQQIDEEALFEALPADSTAHIQAGLGTYVMPGAPLVWVFPPPDDDACHEPIRMAIAVGDERTMQQDSGYGILQLVDIALRALSPGVNDPNTANDVIMSLGVVLLAIWETPEAPRVRFESGRTLVRRDLSHAELLGSTVRPIQRYGAADADVVTTLLTMLLNLRTESVRRGLPGPIEPIDEAVATVESSFWRTDPSPADIAAVTAVLTAHRGLPT